MTSRSQPTPTPAGGDFPPALTVEQAADILGIGRTFAYELIRTNSWPTPVLHIGRLVKIPSGPLIALLEHGQVPAGNRFLGAGRSRSSSARPPLPHRRYPRRKARPDRRRPPTAQATQRARRDHLTRRCATLSPAIRPCRRGLDSGR